MAHSIRAFLSWIVVLDVLDDITFTAFSTHLYFSSETLFRSLIFQRSVHLLQVALWKIIYKLGAEFLRESQGHNDLLASWLTIEPK